jgi:hypothetical protein
MLGISLLQFELDLEYLRHAVLWDECGCLGRAVACGLRLHRGPRTKSSMHIILYAGMDKCNTSLEMARGLLHPSQKVHLHG